MKEFGKSSRYKRATRKGIEIISVGVVEGYETKPIIIDDNYN